MTVVLKLPGRGRYSLVTVHYNQRLQPGQPTPVQLRKGDPFQVGSITYRVVEVRT